MNISDKIIEQDRDTISKMSVVEISRFLLNCNKRLMDHFKNNSSMTRDDFYRLYSEELNRIAGHG